MKDSHLPIKLNIVKYAKLLGIKATKKQLWDLSNLIQLEDRAGHLSANTYKVNSLYERLEKRVKQCEGEIRGINAVQGKIQNTMFNPKAIGLKYPVNLDTLFPKPTVLPTTNIKEDEK